MMKDELLIYKFRSGDVGAFNTLVWRWEKQIYNFILRYLGDTEASKDVLQRTFIRVYKNLSKLRDPGKFSSWLFQIALNQCKDELKKRKHNFFSIDEIRRNDDCEDKEIRVAPIDTDRQPDDIAQQENISSILKRALQSIPPEQRVVIIMKEYNGLKFVEIAEILKEPLNTIKSRMYYGLTALRKTFEKWGIDREDLLYEM